MGMIQGWLKLLKWVVLGFKVGSEAFILGHGGDQYSRQRHLRPEKKGSPTYRINEPLYDYRPYPDVILLCYHLGRQQIPADHQSKQNSYQYPQQHVYFDFRFPR